MFKRSGSTSHCRRLVRPALAAAVGSGLRAGPRRRDHPVRGGHRRRRTRVRRLRRPRAGRLDGADQPGRHDAPRRHAGPCGRAAAVGRRQVLGRQRHVARPGQRRRRIHGRAERLVPGRRGVRELQRFAGPEAGHGLDRQLRHAAQLRRRLGGTLLRAEGDHARPVVHADRRLQGQRQGVGGRRAQRDVRHLQEPGGDQQRQPALRRRPAQDEGRDLGLGRQRRRALRARCAHPVRPRVEFADQPGLQRPARVHEPGARPPEGPGRARAAQRQR